LFQIVPKLASVPVWLFPIETSSKDTLHWPDWIQIRIMIRNTSSNRPGSRNLNHLMSDDDQNCKMYRWTNSYFFYLKNSKYLSIGRVISRSLKVYFQSFKTLHF
jgi:hypothetical protein